MADDAYGDGLESLHHLLSGVPALHERFFDLRELGPAPESPALIDLQVPLGAEVRAGAISAANSALDHLNAWAVLFVRGERLPAFAHYTLLRTTVEAASRARWLVDATAESRVRVARGVGALLADLGERNRVERLPRPAGAPPPLPMPGSRTAAERIAEAQDRAAAAGICPLPVRHTELAERFGLGEPSYRILSAFTHGGQAIPFAASDRDEPDPHDAGGLRSTALTASTAVTLRFTSESIVLCRLTAREVFAYHGHALEPPPADEPVAR